MQHGTPDSQRDTEFSFFASHDTTVIIVLHNNANGLCSYQKNANGLS